MTALSSTSRLTAGQLHWLLDPNVSRVANAAVDNDNLSRTTTTTTTSPTTSFPDRLKTIMQQQDSLLSQDVMWQTIHEIDAHVDAPTKLLTDYDTTTLQSLLGLPPEMATYMQEFLQELVCDITVMTSLKFRLPRPLFNSQDQPFCVETLIPHHIIDLSTVAFDKQTGRRLLLTDDADAFTELQKTGIYKRGDYYITFNWYPGRDKIRLWRNQALAESLYQWTVQLPSTVVGREQTILLGLSQFVTGIGIVLNRLTGAIPTLFPEYTPREIDENLSTAYFQWLQDTEGFVLQATETLDNGRISRSLPRTSKICRYPVIFEHPMRGKLDFRTLVPRIQAHLNRILSEERQAVEKRLGPQRMSIITTHIPSLGEEAAINRYLDLWHEAYLEAIKGRRHAIDPLSGFPDLTETVLQEERARHLVARILLAKSTKQAEDIKAATESWTAAHPILACSDKFVEEQRALVASRLEEATTSICLRDALLEAGLYDLSLMLESQDKFEQSRDAIELRETLQRGRRPGIVKIGFLKRPSRWTVERREIAGETHYDLVTSQDVQIHSSVPFWRLQVFVLRYISWIWNSSFYAVHQASVALARWNVLRTGFDIRIPSVKPSTGEFETTPIRTLRGRLVAILDWQRRILEKARSDEHILRLRDWLYIDTCWAYFWTAIGVSLGSSSVALFSIGETVIVVLGAGVALVTSPVWSLVGNMGRCLYNAFVHDCELDTGDNSRSPLFRNLFGIPNILLSPMRGAFHLAKGDAVVAAGGVRYVWNRLWHGLMTTVLKRAEVPTKAEGFLWSTSGPGMKTSFVLIDAETGILALLTYLSQQELFAARQEMYDDLQEPRRVLAARVQEHSVHAMNLNEIGLVSRALASTEADHRKALRMFRNLDETERQYKQLLQGVQGNPQIRMTALELGSFTARAVPVVMKFYLERHFPRLKPSDIVQFWESRNLLPGDWQGLTNHIMASIFTNEIVVPFEAASDDLVVDANRMSGLERIVQEALREQGVATGESTEYRIGHPVCTKNIPHAPDYQDLPIQFRPQPIDEQKCRADK